MVQTKESNKFIDLYEIFLHSMFIKSKDFAIIWKTSGPSLESYYTLYTRKRYSSNLAYALCNRSVVHYKYDSTKLETTYFVWICNNDVGNSFQISFLFLLKGTAEKNS